MNKEYVAYTHNGILGSLKKVMRETEGRRKRDRERERGRKEGQDDCMVSPTQWT